MNDSLDLKEIQIKDLIQGVMRLKLSSFLWLLTIISVSLGFAFSTGVVVNNYLSKKKESTEFNKVEAEETIIKLRARLAPCEDCTGKPYVDVGVSHFDRYEINPVIFLSKAKSVYEKLQIDILERQNGTDKAVIYGQSGDYIVVSMYVQKSKSITTLCYGESRSGTRELRKDISLELSEKITAI